MRVNAFLLIASRPTIVACTSHWHLVCSGPSPSNSNCFLCLVNFKMADLEYSECSKILVKHKMYAKYIFTKLLSLHSCLTFQVYYLKFGMCFELFPPIKRTISRLLLCSFDHPMIRNMGLK